MLAERLNNFIRSILGQNRPEKIPEISTQRPTPIEEPEQEKLDPRTDAEVDKQIEITTTVARSAPRKPVRHQYFFDAATWLVNGTYINEKAISIEVEGTSVVTHKDGHWLNKVSMELKAINSGEYRSLEDKTIYEYGEIGADEDSLAWRASNAIMGRLHGVLVIVDDTILSSYQTTSGSIRGVESYHRVSSSEYQCRGALFEAGNKSSSWVLRYDKS